MTTFQYLNLILLNAVAWALFSYYWSFWTYKLFKPFKWLDFVKEKLLSKAVLKAERKEKEKVMYYMLWLQLERINKHQIAGDLAEVGVFKGESANLIHHMLPNRPLHLFDTFCGYPKDKIHDNFDSHERVQRADYMQCSAKNVQSLLGNAANVTIHEGVFPQTAVSIESNTFAFVHLDADLYQTTLDGLRFFYPKLVPGGTLVVENYNHNWPGVTRAIDEFRTSIAEEFVEMPNQYGAAVLIKNRLI